MTVATQGINRAPRPSGLADVLEVVLDKGIVIDAYVRVAVVGIELLTVDARIVIASVDTYLRFAEAVNRLDISPDKQVSGVPGLMDELSEGGSERKTRGALAGVKDTAKEMFSFGDKDDEDDSDDDEDKQPARRSRARKSTSSSKES